MPRLEKRPGASVDSSSAAVRLSLTDDDESSARDRSDGGSRSGTPSIRSDGVSDDLGDGVGAISAMSFLAAGATERPVAVTSARAAWRCGRDSGVKVILGVEPRVMACTASGGRARARREFMGCW